MRRKVVSSFAIAYAAVWLAVPMSVSADPTTSGQDAAIDVFLAVSARALERSRFQNRAETDILDRVLSQGVKLRALLNERGSSMPLEFHQSLVELTEMVSSVEVSNVSTSANVRELELVHRDVSIKCEYLLNSAGGFAFRKNLEVLVEIVTMKDGKPLAGYEVAFNPLRSAANQQPRYPVASTTNNAKRLLPPGLYVMTLRRTGNEFNRVVEVGEEGSEAQTIRIDL